jgi:hypothetical protein
VDHLEQPDQGLSSHGPGHQHHYQGLGQGCCSTQRKDHKVQTFASGMRLCKNSQDTTQATQGSVFDGGHLLHQQDPILSDIVPYDLLHGHQPSS